MVTWLGDSAYQVTRHKMLSHSKTNQTVYIDTKAGILGQRDAMVFCEQVGVRTQTQYKQEWLGDLFTADTLYGVQVLRPESALAISFPA